MNNRILIWSVILLVSIVTTLQAKEANNSKEPRRFALLIGCTEYIHLPSNRWLKGPSNDVLLTADLLQNSRFGVPKENIVMLIHENEESMRPYREIIIAQFQELVAKARKDDEIIILLAGHGSQQPNDSKDSDDLESDNQDEVFLPEDIPHWRSDTPLDSAITDDQIAGWIKAIRKKGAFVFLVVDTCHAGTMSRGPGDEEGFTGFRYLERQPATGADENAKMKKKTTSEPVPTVLNSGEEKNKTMESASDGLLDGFNKDAEEAGYVALYAVPSHETEKEERMPRPARITTPKYGRLTYAMNSVLRNTTEPISYQELSQEINWFYNQIGWYPMAYVDGTHLDRSVLGREQWTGRSDVILSRKNRKLHINTGLLSEIRKGCKFAVYFPASNSNADVQGIVEVIDATATTAVVQPCSFAEHPLVSEEILPVPGRCKLVYQERDSARILVKVVKFPETETSLKPTQRELDKVKQIVKNIERQPSSYLKLAGPGESAELYIVVEPGQVILRRNGDTYETAEFQKKVESFGPFQIEHGLYQRLDDALLTASRAINLRKLASNEMNLRSRVGRGYNLVKYDVKLEVMRAGTEKFVPVEPLGLVLNDQDRVRVLVSNTGNIDIDVNILYIESGFRITSYRPYRADVVSGNYTTTVHRGGKPADVVIKINTSTLGMEDLLILVTKSTPRPAEFIFLEQDGLQPLRGNRIQQSRGPGARTPLDSILNTSLFNVGTTRGGSVEETRDYAIHRMSWRIKE